MSAVYTAPLFTGFVFFHFQTRWYFGKHVVFWCGFITGPLEFKWGGGCKIILSFKPKHNVCGLWLRNAHQNMTFPARIEQKKALQAHCGLCEPIAITKLIWGLGKKGHSCCCRFVLGLRYPKWQEKSLCFITGIEHFGRNNAGILGGGGHKQWRGAERGDFMQQSETSINTTARIKASNSSECGSCVGKALASAATPHSGPSQRWEWAESRRGSARCDAGPLLL